MKELIPLRRLIEELTKALGVKRSEEEKLSCVFKDNQGALTLANTEMPMTTPRTNDDAQDQALCDRIALVLRTLCP